MIKVNIKEENGWKKLFYKDMNLWLKGYIFNKKTEILLKELKSLPLIKIEDYLCKLDGHFALVIQTKSLTLVSVDKIRSIPIFWMDNEINIHAPTMVKNNKINKLNQDAILSIKMSGYTINEDTIYQGLNSLIAGQYVIFNKNKVKRNYYYSPLPSKALSEINYKKNLASTTLRIIKKMIKSLNGRQIVVPLSAGYDSRLIVSGLSYLGYKNVKCYSYGTKGNFESKIAKIIANKLGYEYKFIPLTIRSEREFYKSKEFKRFLYFADSCVSVPYFQSLSTIPKLKNWIEKDAIFVNGNTGDFISGGHIITSTNDRNNTTSKKSIKEIILKKIINKHFSLWSYQKTEKNIKNIKSQLVNKIPKEIIDNDKDYVLPEYSEFINRQSKYVINGQRSYEFYGYEWRLPLWDDEYLYYWQQVPVELKKNQKLYTSMLKSENWGGVWGEDIPVNKKTIRPLWLIPLRFIAKLPFVLFGKKAWHQFETAVFYYFMDVTKMICIKGYLTVIKDVFKGPRNHLSWQVKDYIKSKEEE